MIRGLLANSLETAALGDAGFYDVGTGPGSIEAKYSDWLTITDQAASVLEDDSNPPDRKKGRPSISAGPARDVALVAGAGFEPTTSGL